MLKSCPACGQSLELSWTICPYCATPQTSYEDPAVITSYVQPMAVPRPTAPRNRRRSQATPSSDPNARTSGSLEFIDGEEL
ncbi:MAG: zinc ribbon domain-containing protein [Anaerolineae bacterium]|nr:zinc ribbon domain-containing protein [Anaerolineae bacterium]